MAKAKLLTAAPRGIWFHGTYFKNLRSILAQGLVPSVKEKNWHSDPDASTYAPSRESYGGTYVTTNIGTAMMAPRNWFHKDGRVLLIAMELQPNTFYLDEDYVNSTLNSALGRLSDHYYSVEMAWVAATQMGKFQPADKYQTHDKERWAEAVAEYKAKYIEDCLRFFAFNYSDTDTMHPQLKERMGHVLDEMWLPALTRLAVHFFRKGKDYDWKKTYAELTHCEWDQVPPMDGNLPTVAEAESDFMKHSEQITRTLRSQARPDTEKPGFRDTARVTTPIGYHGSNRIVAVMEIREGKQFRGEDTIHTPVDIVLHYGTIPDSFWKQWKERYGYDTNVIKPEKKVASRPSKSPPRIVYHSTNVKFDQFRNTGKLIFFADDPEWTESWGKRTIAAHITLTNPYIIREAGRHLEELLSKSYVAGLKKRGYDGVAVLNDDGDCQIYAVMSPSQIEIIDPNFKPKKVERESGGGPSLFFSKEDDARSRDKLMQEFNRMDKTRKKADYIDDQGFWAGEGGGASGILPICTETKRICLAWRSSDVNQGDCWGTLGGAIKNGMKPGESAQEEMGEETGYTGNIQLHPAYVFSSGTFKYHNFIGVVPKEFGFSPEHEHSWETDFIEWFTLEQIYAAIQEDPDEFHPGIVSLFKESRDLIEKCVGTPTDPEPAKKDSRIESNEYLEGLLKPRGGGSTGTEKEKKLSGDVSVFIDPNGSYRFVKFIGGQPVAAAQVLSKDKKTAHVSNMYVAPEHRRRGYGTELMQHARKMFPSGITFSDDLSQQGDGFVRTQMGKNASWPPPLTAAERESLKQIYSRAGNDFQEWLREYLGEDADPSFEEVWAEEDARLDYLRDWLQSEQGIDVEEDGACMFWKMCPDTERLIGDLPVLLYHHTAEALLPKIKREGLRSDVKRSNPDGNSGAGVYLTSEGSGQAVGGYQRISGSRFKNRNGVALLVRTHLSDLVEDPDDADVQSVVGCQFVVPYVAPEDIIFPARRQRPKKDPVAPAQYKLKSGWSEGPDIQWSDLRVGDGLTLDGVDGEITEIKADGSIRIRDDKSEVVVTWSPDDMRGMKFRVGRDQVVHDVIIPERKRASARLPRGYQLPDKMPNHLKWLYTDQTGPIVFKGQVSWSSSALHSAVLYANGICPSGQQWDRMPRGTAELNPALNQIRMYSYGGDNDEQAMNDVVQIIKDKYGLPDWRVETPQMRRASKQEEEPEWAPWVGVDLDQTIAEEIPGNDYSDPTLIGPPIPDMVNKIRKALQMGMTIKIFTARMADKENAEKIAKAIGDWTEEHVGTRLDATNEKDPGMVEIWDDKARRVEKGTGKFAAVPTTTPEFKTWFSGSKVVDAHGNPLRVYHGTARDQVKWRPGKPAFFTDDPSVASELAFVDEFDGGSPYVLPCYLSIKNPKKLPEWTGGNGEESQTLNVEPGTVAKIEAEGYDGVFGVNEDGTVSEYVAFSPKQIRPAIGPPKTAFVSNDLIWLKDYLQMSDEQKGEELARTFHETFVDWLEQQDFESDDQPEESQDVPVPTDIPAGMHWEEKTWNGGKPYFYIMNAHGACVCVGESKEQALQAYAEAAKEWSQISLDADAREGFMDGLRNWEDDKWTAIPKEMFKKFMDDEGSECMMHDPAECPTFMHMSFESIVKNQWLLHKTDDADGVCRKGFTIGMQDMARLGLTTYYKESGKLGGYNFAFPAHSARIAEGRYGKDAVIFRASGIEVYHYGDSERQVIFRGSEAHDLIPVYHTDEGWCLSEDDHDKPVYQAESLLDVVNWVEKNYAQYRKVIVKRAAGEDDRFANLSFQDDCYDAHGNESFCTLRAIAKDSTVVGYIDYNSGEEFIADKEPGEDGYEDEEGYINGHREHFIWIKMIEVMPEAQRRGIATQMMAALKEKNPEYKIVWSGTTPDGAGLKDSIDKAAGSDFDFNKTMNELLDKLKRRPYAKDIMVFGSCARGKEVPGDIDVFVDRKDQTFDDFSQSKMSSELLWFSLKYYGSFDPFVLLTLGNIDGKPQTILITRNDQGTGWVRAKRAREILNNIRAEGKPLESVPRLKTADTGKNPPGKPETTYAEGTQGWAAFPDQRPDQNVTVPLDKLIPQELLHDD